MVLLHGFTGSSASWGDHLLDGLTSSGIQPVLVDLPGHGRHVGETDPAAFTLDAAFEALSEALRPGPAPMVGYSMGGRLSLAYAVRHPERVTHLVLESSSPGLAAADRRSARRTSDEDLAATLESEGMGAFVELWEAIPLFASQRALPPAVREAQRNRRLMNHAGSLAAALRGLGTGVLPSLWDALAGLRIPTLLIVGEQDVKFTEIARKMSTRLCDTRVVVAKGAGHAVHLERPDSWLEAVLGFLS